MTLENLALGLNSRAAKQSPMERIAALRDALPGRLLLTTSFGLEDQVLTHMLAQAGLGVEFATLDTGRMFPQTYEVWQRTQEKYGVEIAAFSPQAPALQALVSAQGINGFYGSVVARKACCGVRKVEPLERSLAGVQGWIVGLRADQSDKRGGMEFVSFDAARNLVKLSPIFDWTREQAVAFTAREKVPVHALHEKGFLSIGCAPCTRALAPGEPERAGRWWWEAEATKECGLHVGADGRLVRASESPRA